MAKSKKIDDKTANDERVERALYEAMCAHGLILPVTPDAVARADQELANTDLSLPPSLCEPPDFDVCIDEAQISYPLIAVPSDVQENLASAAREGKVVTPEIEERMRADRVNAERARGG